MTEYHQLIKPDFSVVADANTHVTYIQKVYGLEPFHAISSKEIWYSNAKSRQHTLELPPDISVPTFFDDGVFGIVLVWDPFIRMFCGPSLVLGQTGGTWQTLEDATRYGQYRYLGWCLGINDDTIATPVGMLELVSGAPF